LIVIDASGVVDVVLDVTPRSRLIAEALLEHSGDIHAPHLLDAEVGQVMRRYLLRKEISLDRAREALEILADLQIVRHGHAGFLSRALALRRNLTVYDALYVALAEALKAPLLTRDAGIARSARRYVEVIHIR
jgi:predicted nucleic acid-binding protein